MQTILLCPLSDVPDWLEKLQQEYLKKLRPFTSFEIRLIKVKKHGRDQAEYKKSIESEAIAEQLKEQDYVILLDEKGKERDSIEFSKQLSRWQVSGKKRLVFIIGGAYGVSDELKAKSHEKIRLSSLTFNHYMAQAVFLEQLYRAHTILRGIPYHNL